MFWKLNLFLSSGEKTGRHLTQIGLVITILNQRKDSKEGAGVLKMMCVLSGH
jgi:hypothetical protein